MYFTIKELINSSVAKRYGIDNTPDEKTLSNLELLIKQLDSIRSSFGSPIIVTSGYRCPELNKLVGGSKTSAHVKGLAADLICNDNKKLFELIRDNFDYDQLINEKNYSWIHYGLAENNRHECFKQ